MAAQVNTETIATGNQGRVYVARIIEKNQSHIDFSNDSTVINYLHLNGFEIDNKSGIHIHEEKNYIDLRCFDCVVRKLDPSQEVQSSLNERSFTP